MSYIGLADLDTSHPVAWSPLLNAYDDVAEGADKVLAWRY